MSDKLAKSVTLMHEIAKRSLDEVTARFAEQQGTLLQLRARLERIRVNYAEGNSMINGENSAYLAGYLLKSLSNIEVAEQAVEQQELRVASDEKVLQQHYGEVKRLEALLAELDAQERAAEEAAEKKHLDEVSQQIWLRKHMSDL